MRGRIRADQPCICRETRRVLPRRGPAPAFPLHLRDNPQMDRWLQTHPTPTVTDPPVRGAPQDPRPPGQALSPLFIHTLFHTLMPPLLLFHWSLSFFLFALLLTGSCVCTGGRLLVINNVFTKGFSLSYTFLSASLIVLYHNTLLHQY